LTPVRSSQYNIYLAIQYVWTYFAKGGERTMSNQIDVAVVYNGVTKTIKVNLSQAVQAVLQHALDEFGIHQNRENFALFNASGQELNASSSAQDAGITAGAQLLLRPRQVRGGM
jgi:hypothetical protein